MRDRKDRRVREEREKPEDSILDRLTSYGKTVENRLAPYLENAKNTLFPFKTQILSGFLAVAMGLGAFSLSYRHESARDRKIPLGFSEIHQIEFDFLKKDNIAELDESVKKEMPRTHYLAGLNDLTMKIFECWNDSNSSSMGNEVYSKFAKELEKRFDEKEKKHHYELSDLFEIVPKNIIEVKKQLRNYQTVLEKSPNIIDLFNRSWSEFHIDTYHTEFYTETETYTDSQGNSHTRSVIKSRQVYDYTTHTYNYHRQYGEGASFSLDQLIDLIPEIRLTEFIHTASKTNPQGEKAIIESRKKQNKPLGFSQEKLLETTNTWYNGSTITLNERKINSLWPNLIQDSVNWRTSKANGKNHWYITYSHFDSGPQEYGVCYRSRDDCRSLLQSCKIALDSVEYTEKSLPELRTKISRFIEISRNNSNLKKQAYEIMESTQRLYKKNYVGGFDVAGFRTWMVILSTALGTGLGGFLGFGAGRFLEKTKRSEQY